MTWSSSGATSDKTQPPYSPAVREWHRLSKVGADKTHTFITKINLRQLVRDKVCSAGL